MTTPDPESKPPRKRASRKKSPPEITLPGFELEHGVRLESLKSPEEIRSRLKIEEAKASHEIWRDKSILICCLSAVPILVVACLLVLVIPGGSVESRTWAASTLTGIVTGIVGYSLGQHGKLS